MMIIMAINLVAWLSTDFLALITALLRLPVLIILYGMTLWVLVEVGMLTYEGLVRVRAGKGKNIRDIDGCLEEARAKNDQNELIAIIKNCVSHKYVLQFLNRLGELRHDAQFHIRVQKLIQEFDALMVKQVERTGTMVRIGPMLGLMGTLIPMGPALLALSNGDVHTLATALIYAFGTTVLGLLVGGIAYVVTMTRQHWYDKDLNDIRYICEMLFGE